MQFPCGNEKEEVMAEESGMQVCIEEKSMNFKTGKSLRSLPPDNESKRQMQQVRAEERERTSKQEISMAANVMNNISSVNPAN